MISIGKILRDLGYDTVNLKMYGYIRLWKEWYRGKVRKFHSYNVYNGSKRIKCERLTLGMAKTVCEDWASLLLNEKTIISTADEASTQEVENVLADNDFWVVGNSGIEEAFATGTGAFVLSIDSMNVDPDTGDADGGSIRVDFVDAEGIYPLSWSKGRVTECAFVYEKVVRSEERTILNVHSMNEDGMYVIKNFTYDKNGTQISNDGIVDEFHTECPFPWFSIIQPNITNNLFDDMPLGVSVFANAIDNLKGTDLAYDGFCVELNIGKKRIIVAAEATKVIEGERVRVFDPDDVVFYELPAPVDGKSMITEFNPTLRSEEYKTSIQTQLDLLSTKVGLGHGYYKFESSGATTATEVISENSDTFRNKKKHDIKVISCLTNLTKGILFISKEFLGKSVDPDAEITVSVDDSIIEDKNSEMLRDMQLITNRIMDRVQFRVKWFGESEEDARRAIQEIDGGTPRTMEEDREGF